MKSIQRNLIVWLLVTTLSLAAACGAYLYLHARSELVEEFDRALVARARLLMDGVTENGKRLHFELPDGDLSEYHKPKHPGYFQIWQADGTVVVRSKSLNGKDILPAVPPPTEGDAIDLPDGQGGRCVVMRFHPQLDEDEESDGAATKPVRPEATILVAGDRDRLDDTLRVLLSSLLVAAGGLALGTIAVVMIGVRRGLRPLHRLGREADAITASSLGNRFSVQDLPAELRPIALRLNELLARIDEAFARERRFTADVAHELRTPIAELKSIAEVALKWPDKSAGEQNYQDALAVAGQMESLVTTLLAIARCESGVATARLENVNLAESLHQAWRMQAKEAERKQITVAWDAPLEARAFADKAMLAALLDNLVSNAVRYTPDKGRIELKVSDGDGVQLSISNTCHGLTTDDLPHLFEPFWRKDAARTSGAGCGLGLSLVSGYAAAMQASVNIDLPRPDWFTVTLRLRATSA